MWASLAVVNTRNEACGKRKEAQKHVLKVIHYYDTTTADLRHYGLQALGL